MKNKAIFYTVLHNTAKQALTASSIHRLTTSNKVMNSSYRTYYVTIYKHRQYTYTRNLTFRSIRGTIVAMEKQ
jgi:hypothetical protein